MFISRDSKIVSEMTNSIMSKYKEYENLSYGKERIDLCDSVLDCATSYVCSVRIEDRIGTKKKHDNFRKELRQHINSKINVYNFGIPWFIIIFIARTIITYIIDWIIEYLSSSELVKNRISSDILHQQFVAKSK